MRNRRTRTAAKAAGRDLRPLVVLAGTALVAAALSAGWLSAVPAP